LYYDETGDRIRRWLLWALACGSLALLLCGASKDNGWIPINKHLWSLSFVLALSSLAFVSLALCYYLIDVRRLWSGAPFIYPGLNSIVVYFGSEVLGVIPPFI
jgi:heparan-alpha-glucosaminide N-acetyltransferase